MAFPLPRIRAIRADRERPPKDVARWLDFTGQAGVETFELNVASQLGALSAEPPRKEDAL